MTPFVPQRPFVAHQPAQALPLGAVLKASPFHSLQNRAGTGARVRPQRSFHCGVELPGFQHIPAFDFCQRYLGHGRKHTRDLDRRVAKGSALVSYQSMTELETLETEAMLEDSGAGSTAAVCKHAST
jgi:hypothetical protein